MNRKWIALTLIVALVIVAIPLWRLLMAPTPETVTPEYLNALSTLLIFYFGDGVTTLSDSKSRDAQRVTLQMLNQFSEPGSQRIKVGIKPQNTSLMKSLADSLGKDAATPIVSDSTGFTLELAAESDGEMIALVESLLERCLLELGIQQGEEVYLRYKGSYTEERYKSYLEKHFVTSESACEVIQRAAETHVPV